MASMAGLHREQLDLFRAESDKLAGVIESAGDAEILFGGTLTAHSGRGVAMVAPVRGLSQDTLLDEGGLIAVLWLTPGSIQTGVPRKLRAGIYGLRFKRRGRVGARLEFLAPNGRVAHAAGGVLMLAGDDDPTDVIKKILKKLGFDLKLVDLEILFDGKRPTKVRISVAFWSFDLFDDP